jgi:outer membrane factor, OMF family
MSNFLRHTWLFKGLGAILWLSLGTSAMAQPDVTPTPIPTPSTSTNLSPNADLLLRPTKPEEVQIKTNQPITLKQAVELGLKNNRDLQSAIVTLERSRAQLDEAVAAQLPRLSTNLQLDHSRSAGSDISRQISEANGGDSAFLDSIDLNSTNFSGSLQVDYDIYTGGRRGANIAKAEEQIKFSQLDIDRTTEQTKFDVTDSYYTLQNADAQVLIAQAAVDDTTRTLRDAQLLLKAGLGTQFDVLRAEVDLARAQQDLTQGLANQKIARKRLAQVISVGQDVELTAADQIIPTDNWTISLEESIVKAYTNRVELDQQASQKEINRQDSVVALSDIKPQVALFANYNFLDNFNDIVGAGQGYAIGARVNWQFFDGGRAQARAEQSYRGMDLAEVAFAKQREQIRQQVEESYFNLNSNKENIGTTQKNVTRAEESLRLARLRFQAGVGTQTDVINAQRDLTNARSQYLQAIIGYNRSYNSLQRAVSRPSSFKVSTKL